MSLIYISINSGKYQMFSESMSELLQVFDIYNNIFLHVSTCTSEHLETVHSMYITHNGIHLPK